MKYNDKIEVCLWQGRARMPATLTKEEFDMMLQIRSENPKLWEYKDASLLLEAQKRLSEK